MTKCRHRNGFHWLSYEFGDGYTFGFTRYHCDDYDVWGLFFFHWGFGWVRYR